MFNLVIVLFVTFAFALFLVYFIAKHDRKMAMADKIKLNPETQNPEHQRKLFFRFCADLTEYLKLETLDFQQLGANQITIRAEGKNEITRVDYLVVGFFCDAHETVSTSQIMEISDQMVSERIAKGILITSGQFDPAIKSYPELANIEFIAQDRVLELKEKIIL